MACVPTVLALSACTLDKVSAKTGFGPEYRHSGSTDTDSIRYNVRHGIDLHWDNDVTTGVTYRRRDVDEGNGDNDNLVLFEVGYPIWKRQRPQDDLAARLAQLEKRVRELEHQLAGATLTETAETVHPPTDTATKAPD